MKFPPVALSLCLLAGITPCRAYALEPTFFLKVLDIDAGNLRTGHNAFSQVRKILGEARPFVHKDKDGRRNLVEYTLKNGSEMITFDTTECTSGYAVQRITSKEANGRAILKKDLDWIEVEGLRLGIDRHDTEQVFLDTVSEGWKLESATKDAEAQHYVYRHAIKMKNYDGAIRKFCDRIWINLEFDREDHLSRYEVESGGCDDAACQGDDE